MSASLLQRFFPFLAVLGSVTALGIGTSWAKHWLFPVVGAQGTTAVRVGFSALLVLLLWRPWRWPLSRADARAIVLYGAALGGMNLMFYMSLRTLPFGLAVAIEFSGPLAVAIWSSRRAVDFVWVALAMAGLGMLLPLGLNGSTLDPVGVLYALGAAVFWALYIVFGKRAGHLHAGHTVSLGLLVAGTCGRRASVAQCAAHWRGGGGSVQRHPDLAGDDGPEAPAQGGLRHHDQHGACGGCRAGLDAAGRTPERPAVAGHWLHRGSVDGQRRHRRASRGQSFDRSKKDSCQRLVDKR
jgi:hypothetical protein